MTGSCAKERTFTKMLRLALVEITIKQAIFDDNYRPNNKIGIVSTYSEEVSIPEYRYKIDCQMFRRKNDVNFKRII